MEIPRTWNADVVSRTDAGDKRVTINTAASTAIGIGRSIERLIEQGRRNGGTSELLSCTHDCANCYGHGTVSGKPTRQNRYPDDVRCPICKVKESQIDMTHFIQTLRFSSGFAPERAAVQAELDADDTATRVFVERYQAALNDGYSLNDARRIAQDDPSLQKYPAVLTGQAAFA